MAAKWKGLKNGGGCRRNPQSILLIRLPEVKNISLEKNFWSNLSTGTKIFTFTPSDRSVEAKICPTHVDSSSEKEIKEPEGRDIFKWER
eukprot:scaffold19604_cov60-Attheya_sp.AAC.6